MPPKYSTPSIVEGMRGQAERAEERGGKMSLKREIVDREYGPRPRAAVVMEIGRRERGLPVVGMNDFGDETLDRAAADVGADARQRGEALGVVGPVEAVGAEIGIARPVVEMRRFEHEEVEPGRAARRGLSPGPPNSDPYS